jgi:signal transduction histidine kinase/ligand-binding sensor domain-containing protein
MSSSVCQADMWVSVHQDGEPRRPACTSKLACAGWLLILTAVVCAIKGAALEPGTPLADFGRQSWVMENGLPQNSVHALLQTRDGYLWLGTEAGLVRFDGNSFAVFDHSSNPALPSGDIRCLLESKDGALWVGTSDGLARWKDGAVTVFTTANGLPANGIRELTLVDGHVTVTSESGEASIEGDKAIPVQNDKLTSLEPSLRAVFTARLADGRLARATNTEVEIQQPGKTMRWQAGKDLPGTRIQALLADREGSLWIGTNGGLARLVNGTMQKLPVRDPLSGASILSLLEDREGNLWVGTETDGLHILRDQRFRTIGAHEGLSSDATTTVVEDETEKLWIGTSGSGLNVVRLDVSRAGEATVYSVPDVLPSNVILSLANGTNGSLWVGTPDGLNRIRGSAVDSFTSADGLPDDFIRSLLADTDGSLWVGTRHGLAHLIFNTGDGVARRSPALTTIYTQANGLGSDLVGAMARDTRGNLWVATLAGLSRLRNGQITNYTTANGLPSNVVTSLLPREGGTVLIGTQDHGWSLWDGSQFDKVNPPPQDATNVHAILADDRNNLWFATNNGLARCTRTTASDCSNWIEFGPADGLRGRETATNSHPSAWRSHDGRLWFATPKGLVEVDPDHFPINSVPPPVVVERFAIDDVDQLIRPVPSLRVPAGHNHFQFDYAALSFVAPQKVRYRYMLEGFDRGWTDAGSRRIAYYTNIPPGRYTFRVQAANNDGVWNTQGAALQFELRPHFYQTLWFYILLTAAVAGLLAVILKRRLLVAEREFKAVLGERNRIAREIHDTLAQGYVGISVQLEVLAELLRQNKLDAAARQLDEARGHVREGLTDARQSIWALRSQDSDESTLPVRLRRATEQTNGHGIEASFSVHGAYRAMSPGVEREFLRVAMEAIHNVKKHAGAQHLHVQLDYGPAEIALEVRDDGRGFAGDGESHSQPGHYGLTGMRERAAAIGGTLEVTSEPGGGTHVRLRTPAPREAQ